jgi:PIN domain nuclease of toxin-antitoxin system
VRLLVDTHFLVWWAAGRRIPKRASSFIQDPANELYASAASVWEIAIKVGLGRLDVNLVDFVRALDAQDAVLEAYGAVVIKEA